MQDERRMNMKDKSFSRYYSLACIGVLVASYYPLSMGIRVITDMIVDGAVLKENYPKYIIPYTPMCIAIIIGVFAALCGKKPLKSSFFRRSVDSGGVLFYNKERVQSTKIVNDMEGSV